MTNNEAIATIDELKKLFRDNTTLIALTLATTALKREETCENKDYGTEMIFECSVCGANTIDRMNWENGEFNYCPNCGRRVEK